MLWLASELGEKFLVITMEVWLVLFMVILFKIPLKKLSPCVELLRPYMELFQYNLFVMVELQNSNAPTKNIKKLWNLSPCFVNNVYLG